MLKHLWQWWLAGLAGPWPRPLRVWFGSNKTRWWAQPAKSGFRILCKKGKTWKIVADTSDTTSFGVRTRKRVNSNQLVLLVPKENALVRSFNVPADCHPDDYLASMLDEVSPLPADQQYFGHVPGTEGLTLAIARKSYVDERRNELADIGIEVDEVTVAGYEDTPLNLLPDRHRSAAPIDLAGLAMSAAGVLLCAAGLYLLVQKQNDAINSLELQQQRLQTRLQSGQHIRDQIDLLQARVAEIAQRKSGRPSMLNLLDSVTRSIPDHTWVRNWVLDNELLTLFGESADTTDLISRLEASPLLRDVHYDSAITRDPNSDRDRFRISATVGNI